MTTKLSVEVAGRPNPYPHAGQEYRLMTEDRKPLAVLSYLDEVKKFGPEFVIEVLPEYSWMRFLVYRPDHKNRASMFKRALKMQHNKQLSIHTADIRYGLLLGYPRSQIRSYSSGPQMVALR